VPAAATLPIEFLQAGMPVPFSPANEPAYVDGAVRVALKAAPFVIRVPQRIAAHPASPVDPRGGIAINLALVDTAFRSRLVGEPLSSVAEPLGCTLARFGAPRELEIAEPGAPLPGMTSFLAARHARDANFDALDYQIEALTGIPSARNLLTVGQTLYASILPAKTFFDCYAVAEQLASTEDEAVDGANEDVDDEEDDRPPAVDRPLTVSELRLVILSFER
jgi:hypothetical protein